MLLIFSRMGEQLVSQWRTKYFLPRFPDLQGVCEMFFEALQYRYQWQVLLTFQMRQEIINLWKIAELSLIFSGVLMSQLLIYINSLPTHVMCESKPLSLSNVQMPNEKQSLHPKASNWKATGNEESTRQRKLSNVDKSSFCFPLRNEAALSYFHLPLGFWACKSKLALEPLLGRGQA